MKYYLQSVELHRKQIDVITAGSVYVLDALFKSVYRCCDMTCNRTQSRLIIVTDGT